MFKSMKDPEPLTSLNEAPVSDEDRRPTSLDDFPDPEPIPEVFTEGPSPKREKKTGALKLLLVLLVLILGGLVAGFFFGREVIVRQFPKSAALYKMVGLGGEVLGAGLDIRNVKSEREAGETENDDYLVVFGSVVNVSDMGRKVPMLRVSLLDAANKEIQFMVVPPSKTDLGPGDNIGFKARLKNPAPTARRLEVTFTEAKPTGGAPDAKAAPPPAQPAQPAAPPAEAKPTGR